MRESQVAQSETLEQIADRIAYKYLDRTFGSAKLKSDILSALRNERERAAKLTEDIMPIGADDCYWCERVKKAARAIREGQL